MGEYLIKPYEISVWEDKLAQDGKSFTENKIAVIGSDTMTGLNKAYDPVFNKKSNGEKTLTFSLKYKYFDPYSEKEIVNPFVKLLTNERKVKLHYDNNWYEFIVKEHTETSEEYTWEYVCTDAFVLELSKNGYNITFDEELNNNQGSARELAEATIKDTDWRIPENGVDNLKQFVAEPVYKGVIATSFEVYDTDRKINITLATDTKVYVFYTYVKNKDGKFVQFIKQADSYTIDDNNVIIATNYRILRDNIVITDNAIQSGETVLIRLQELETKYQVNRLVYNQLTTYDPIAERTVSRYKVSNTEQEIYKYTGYTYTTSNVLTNYITNGENFNVLEDGTLQGWNPYVDFTKAPEDDKIDRLELVTKPELGAGLKLADLASLSQIEGFLKVKFKGPFTDNCKNAVFNSGIENNSSFLKSISQGEKFVFRWRAGQRDVNEEDETKRDVDCLKPNTTLRLIVAKYTQDTPNRWTYYYKHIDTDNIILRFDGTPKILNNFIKGGELVENEEGKLNYVINGVIQVPSTKYIYIITDSEDNEQEYIWDGIAGTYKKKNDDDDYLPYYYLTATADKAISNTSLTDPTERYGIFIYSVDNNINNTKPIYIQDIQLLRFIPDGSDSTGETPVLIGNVPTATSTSTNYYYLKPEEGMAAEDITMYTSPEELAKTLDIQAEDIIALYNEDSEKNLSISVSKSNCFDILQTIAETFECWVDLVVRHDDRGYILRDEDGQLEKYVYLKEYAGKDNYAGFKYGINLQSIERKIDSNEIVTKLIVEQSQSDHVDEGFVSIASAPSNPSKESYILNFDYYYNQGLLDAESTEDDKKNFISAVANLNLELQEKEKTRISLENSLTALGSKRNVYTELVNTAQDNKTEALGDFENLVGQSYQEYQEQQSDEFTKEYNNKFYILTKDDTVIDKKKYYIYENEVITEVTNPTGDPSAQKFYELLPDLAEEETIVDLIGTIYASSATINNYSGFLTNIEEEYWKVRKQLRGLETYNVKIWVGIDDLEQRHVFIELNDYLPGFKFILGSHTETSTVSVKYFDIQTTDTLITFEAPDGYTIKESTYEINDEKVATFSINPNETQKGIEAEIKQLQEQKDELTKEFNNKYSRFIQEGTWNSTDYINSDLYYLDALQVSNTSAQPAVSYTINVVEVSQLEDLEDYSFDAGEKTYVEDTEFFGWHIDNFGTEENPNLIYTPAREEVIVSEVEWHLDEPDKNVITVQNYKTRFEDLFQRISATVQTVQYNEATYAKISTLLDANGTINQNVLLDSLNNISGREYNLTSNGSIIIKDDVILVQNLTNPANHVIIDSEGIRVSSDGGENYTTVIDGQGINIGAVYTGTLNTNEVVIGDKENPSFRWDKSGISAYKSKEDNTYDLQTYVRYDQYGLYGIKEGETFKAQNLQEVLDKAHFAVTWDGFFIKNSYADGGRVSITSDNDFQVIDGTNTERIKIGSLGLDENENRIYGININDKNGNSILNTDNDGNLTVTGTINAQAGEFSGLVQVGTGDPYIKIDGAKALIGTSNYTESAGRGWMINADGDAVFNNITARGAIKTAVFEYAEIQAVGGVFIFRPSSTIRSAAVSGNNLVLSVEKPILFRVGQWCKVSNYIGKGQEPIDTQPILLNNGLTHVYEVGSKETIDGITYITLLGAAAMIEGQDAIVDNVTDLIGGALVDMGNEAGSSNYGIGINSSDNTVNLPARAISLFETTIDETQEPKVTYNYRGILGTLPPMSSGVDPTVYQYMQNTQGIYTDNMYIGDDDEYIAFYKDNNGKQLKIKANQILFEVSDPEPGEDPWKDIADIEAEGTPGESALNISVHSTVGSQIINGQGVGAIYAIVAQDGQIIDEVPDNIQVGTTYPAAAEVNDLFIKLDDESVTLTNRKARLMKKINTTDWEEVEASCDYEWTFRDKNNNPVTSNVPYQDTNNKKKNQFIYINGELIDTKITINVKVTTDEI